MANPFLSADIQSKITPHAKFISFGVGFPHLRCRISPSRLHLKKGPCLERLDSLSAMSDIDIAIILFNSLHIKNTRFVFMLNQANMSYDTVPLMILAPIQKRAPPEKPEKDQ